MIFLRKILFPFAIIYGWITQFRNFLFDIQILKSYSFEVPTIVVGNLSVGGTGKTPQIEYLIRLLSTNYKVATLSRGYKRKSNGFVLADENASAETIGDEPFQFYKKFPDVQVAVDADRKNGIEQLLSQSIKPEIILLDDAFQHRSVKAGFYILLTSYGDLFCDDFMLPTGNLRENRKGAKRANCIIITKCPNDLSEIEQEHIKKKIGLNKPIFFSSIVYDEKVYNETESKKVSEIKTISKVLLAGIANPKPFFEYFEFKNDINLNYPDHYHFTKNDIQEIKNKSNNHFIITTEKDYVRLAGSNFHNKLFYLPIKTKFVSDENDFKEIILNYIGDTIINI